MKQLELADVQKIMDMLTGKPLDGIQLVDQPQLSQESAFSVIYFLQESVGIIPDSFEMCVECHEVYDSNHSGHCVDAGNYDNDRWWAECGFSKRLVEAHDGAHFCSEHCEMAFFRGHL